MNEKRKRLKKVLDYFENRGFYIILFLCVLSIGISGYVLFFAGNGEKEREEVPYLAVLPEEEEPYEIPSANTAVVSEEEEQKENPENLKEPEKENSSAGAETESQAEISRKESAPKKETETVMRPQPLQEPEEPERFRPVKGEILAPFSEDALVYSPTMGDWRVHRGTDFAAEVGEQVLAIMSGEVSEVYTDEVYGRCVRIMHDGGMETLYTGLMEQAAVKPGERVAAGDVVGGVGESSLLEASEETRLHVEFYQDGELANLESILPSE